MPNRRKQADKYSSAVSRVERLTDLQRMTRAYQRSVRLSRSFNAGRSGTSSRSMSVGSNFVRPPADVRPKVTAIGGARPASSSKGSLRQRLADTAVRNVEMPRGRELRMEAGGRRAT